MAVNRLTSRHYLMMVLAAGVVTAVFSYLLLLLGTANLLFSTISITTSFIASYLTFFRSPYYAIGYAANDLVLIVLWTLATLEDLSYLPMILCFAMFLANDLYGFYSWQNMQKRQLAA